MADRATRLVWLLALEVTRIVDGLDARRPQLVTLWSRTRSRVPFQELLFTRWRTVGVEALLELDADALAALEAFHAAVDDLRLYATFTEDMPTTMADRLDVAVRELAALGDAALAALGDPPVREALAGARAAASEGEAS
jgi:hypothetical protein